MVRLLARRREVNKDSSFNQEEVLRREERVDRLVQAGQTTSKTERTRALLDGLLVQSQAGAPPPLPVHTAAERLPSGARGLSLGALRGIRDFFDAQPGGLNRLMGAVCKESGFDASICALTRWSGLSLAETLVLADGDDAADGLVGPVSSFLSYPWAETSLGDLLSSIEQVAAELEPRPARGELRGPDAHLGGWSAAHAPDSAAERYFWIDMFAASQNMLAGVFDGAPAADAPPEAQPARREDLSALVDGALGSAREVFFYASPLLGEWIAPPHSFVSRERLERGAPPPTPWMRKGPTALTRGWCLLELTSALDRGLALHVALSPADHANFGQLLRRDMGELNTIISQVDARDAQIGRANDRDYLLGQIGGFASVSPRWKTEAGLGTVTVRAVEAMRGWLAAAARHALDALPLSERAAVPSLLLDLGTLLRAQGALPASQLLLREGVSACRARYGDYDPNTLVAIGILASLLHEMGDLEKAEALTVEALAGWRETRGDEAPRTLASITNLAKLLQAQGELAAAEPFFEEALDTRRMTLGDGHPDTLASINDLADLLHAMGDLAAAEPLLREALESRQGTLGSRHPDTLASSSSLASLLQDQGDLEAAEPLYREVLAVRRETLPENHPDRLAALGNLASLLRDKGDLAAAEPLCREALTARRAALGDRHPHTLTSIGSLASLLHAKGDLDAAEPLFREDHLARREIFGDRHPETLVSILNLAKLLQDHGDLAAAEPLCREAVRCQRDTLGDRHPNTLGSMSNLADLLREKGDLAAAVIALGDAPSVAKESLGADHITTLVLVAKSARLTLARKGEAAPLRAAVERMKEVLGPDHQQTRKYETVLVEEAPSIVGAVGAFFGNLFGKAAPAPTTDTQAAQWRRENQATEGLPAAGSLPAPSGAALGAAREGGYAGRRLDGPPVGAMPRLGLRRRSSLDRRRRSIVQL